VIYGTTINGGESSNGSLYRVNPDGTGYAVLKSFFQLDGQHPLELTAVDNALYGTCYFGGTLFKITPDGTFTILHNFTEMPAPLGRLAAIGTTLYGVGFSPTAFSRGVLDPLDEGRLMKINTDGSGFSILTNFTGNLRGDISASGLIVADGMLIGVTRGQPSEVIDPPDNLIDSRSETVKTRASIFQISPSGADGALIYQFGLAPDGTWLNGDLVLDGTTLYGTTYAGGEAGEGTIFSLDLRPKLSIEASSSGVIVSWLPDARQGSLEQTTNLFTAGWTPVSATLLQGGTNITATVGASNRASFFRLKK